MGEIKEFSRKNVHRGDVVQIITNNYCNLHCEWCSLLCHEPSRRWDMKPSHAELFCKRFEGHYTDSFHKLLGGETTAIKPETLYEIIDVFEQYGRKIRLLSNGFNLMGLEEKYINKFHAIELNDHGINHGHVMDCYRWLQTFYDGIIESRAQTKHYDLGEARKHCTVGFPCESIMNPPALYMGVMYPCCIHPGLELWDGDWKTHKALREAGWGLDNPDVAQVLENWRYNLPEHVMNQCSFHCWSVKRLDVKPKKHRITLKENDVIKKEDL